MFKLAIREFANLYSEIFDNYLWAQHLIANRIWLASVLLSLVSNGSNTLKRLSIHLDCYFLNLAVVCIKCWPQIWALSLHMSSCVLIYLLFSRRIGSYVATFTNLALAGPLCLSTCPSGQMDCYTFTGGRYESEINRLIAFFCRDWGFVYFCRPFEYALFAPMDRGLSSLSLAPGQSIANFDSCQTLFWIAQCPPLVQSLKCVAAPTQRTRVLA